MFDWFRNQTYPTELIEWIIVDDGTDKIEDLVKASNILQIKYHSLPTKLTLGEKRNYMHGLTSGKIIVYMDDDDYYPPERISHAVDMLLQNPTYLIAGSSELYVYFGVDKRMIKFGPYPPPNHATAATFAFRRELLDVTQYDPTSCLGEEQAFLKNYSIPMIQLDTKKCILVFSHSQNTFDKRTLLQNGYNEFIQLSDYDVSDFIKNDYEFQIVDFFVQRMETCLSKYLPGMPSMKPDVIKQYNEVVEKRKGDEVASQMTQIQMTTPNGETRTLSMQDVVTIIKRLQEERDRILSQNQTLIKRNQELELMLLK